MIAYFADYALGRERLVRGQQLAHSLAQRLGYDPDAPEGLSKVTVT
jgi:glucosamine 6-phosphate synthetase-like amidotransferase/phosphosugar isomerase protein